MDKQIQDRDQWLALKIRIEYWDQGLGSRIRIKDWEQGLWSRIVIKDCDQGLWSRIGIKDWDQGLGSRIGFSGDQDSVSRSRSRVKLLFCSPIAKKDLQNNTEKSLLLVLIFWKKWFFKCSHSCQYTCYCSLTFTFTIHSCNRVGVGCKKNSVSIWWFIVTRPAAGAQRRHYRLGKTMDCNQQSQMS